MTTSFRFMGTAVFVSMIFMYVGLFYYAIANLRPELRSTDLCVQLISCITSPILKTCGFERVLKPFIDDANELCEVRNVMIKNLLIILLQCHDIFFRDIGTGS